MNQRSALAKTVLTQEIDFLEEAHCDPYSPFGGKIQFHREVQNIIDSNDAEILYILELINEEKI